MNRYPFNFAPLETWELDTFGRAVPVIRKEVNYPGNRLMHSPKYHIFVIVCGASENKHPATIVSVRSCLSTLEVAI